MKTTKWAICNEEVVIQNENTEVSKLKNNLEASVFKNVAKTWNTCREQSLSSYTQCRQKYKIQLHVKTEGKKKRSA